MSPSRAARICTAPGCPNVVPCEVHTVTQNERRAKDPEQRRFYDSARWKSLRSLVRKQEPMCRLCGEKRSTNVDHVDGDWRNNERANLRALCTDCEKRHTARQHRAKATGGGGGKK